ncbi:MAG: hypothetical protein QM655_05615 [Nocardioidaceae bacterium]
MAGWERALARTIDDLEQQAAGDYLVGREAQVADLAVAHYAEVTLASRLYASGDLEVRLAVEGAGAVRGVVAAVGNGWVLLSSGTEVLVPLAGITTAQGLADRALPDSVLTSRDRLGLTSAVRRLAAVGAPVVATLRDGGEVRGQLGRVGADFVELSSEHDGSATACRLAAVALLRRQG